MSNRLAAVAYDSGDSSPSDGGYPYPFNFSGAGEVYSINVQMNTEDQARRAIVRALSTNASSQSFNGAPVRLSLLAPSGRVPPSPACSWSSSAAQATTKENSCRRCNRSNHAVRHDGGQYRVATTA